VRGATYFLLVHGHQPVADVVEQVHFLNLIFAQTLRMRKLDPTDLLVFPPSAKRKFVIQQTQLLNDVVHNQVNVYCRLRAHHLLVSFAQLGHV
jgi:hypothetical protein